MHRKRGSFCLPSDVRSATYNLLALIFPFCWFVADDECGGLAVGTVGVRADYSEDGARAAMLNTLLVSVVDEAPLRKYSSRRRRHPQTSRHA